MSQIYHDLQKFSTPFLEGWRKTRKRNFLLFAFALLQNLLFISSGKSLAL